MNNPDEFIETATITPDSIPEIARRTGKSEEELMTLYRNGLAQNKAVVIMLSKLPWPEREQE